MVWAWLPLRRQCSSRSRPAAVAMPEMGLVLAEGVPAKVRKPETHHKYVGENGIEFSPAPSMLPPWLGILFSFAVVLCPALAFMSLKWN